MRLSDDGTPRENRPETKPRWWPTEEAFDSAAAHEHSARRSRRPACAHSRQSDEILVDREQIRWAERALAAAATARWRVVVGHHSLFTSGAHRGRTMHRHRALLLPLLQKHRVDLYISGHSHHTEHLQYGRTHFLVVGAGSGLDAAPLCDDNCAPQSVHRWRDALGFATLTLGRDGGEAALRDGLGITRHSFKF